MSDADQHDDHPVSMAESKQVAQQSLWAWFRVFASENKWLVGFIIFFLVMMLFPLIFRGGY